MFGIDVDWFQKRGRGGVRNGETFKGNTEQSRSERSLRQMSKDAYSEHPLTRNIISDDIENKIVL